MQRFSFQEIDCRCLLTTQNMTNLLLSSVCLTFFLADRMQWSFSL